MAKAEPVIKPFEILTKPLQKSSESYAKLTRGEAIPGSVLSRPPSLEKSSKASQHNLAADEMLQDEIVKHGGQALRYMEGVAGSLENRILDFVVKGAETNAPALGDAAALTMISLNGMYKSVTGGDIPVSEETIKLLKEKKYSPEAAYFVGQMGGGFGFIAGMGALLRGPKLAASAASSLYRHPTVARFLAPSINWGVASGGAGAVHEGIAQVRQGNLDLERLGKVVMMDTAIGAAGGMMTGGFSSGIFRIAGGTAFGYGSAKAQGASDYEAAVNAGVMGLFAAVSTKQITEAQLKGAFRTATKNTFEFAKADALAKGYSPEKADIWANGQASIFSSKMHGKIGEKGFSVKDFERFSKEVWTEMNKQATKLGPPPRPELTASPGQVPPASPATIVPAGPGPSPVQAGTPPVLKVPAGAYGSPATPPDVPKVPSLESVSAEAQKVMSLANEKYQKPLTDIGAGIASKHGADFVTSPKSPERLAEKVFARSKRGQDYTINSPKDHVRGSIITSPEKLPEIIRDLKQAGFEIEVSVGDAKSSGYQGINAFKAMGEGINGEIQVHTPESFKLVKLSHQNYKKWRNLSGEDIANLSTEDRYRFETDVLNSHAAFEKLWSSMPEDLRLSISAAGMESASKISPTVSPGGLSSQDPLSSTKKPSSLNESILPSGNLENKGFVDMGKPPYNPSLPQGPEKVKPTDTPDDTYGSPAAASAERIQPEPLPEALPKVKPLTTILKDAADSLGQKIFFGKTAKGLGGTYNPTTSATVIRNSGDLNTAAHELTHALDDGFGISKELTDSANSSFDGELSKFWFHGSATTTGRKSEIGYKRAEGVAEFVRAWLVNPMEANRQAPKFSEYFFSKITPETTEALESFSKDIRAFAGASAHEQIMANVSWRPPDSDILQFFSNKNTGPGFSLTWADRLKGHMSDDLQAFNKAVEFTMKERGIERPLPEDNPIILARLLAGVHAKMDDIFEHGMINAKGERVTKAFSEMLEPLDNTTKISLEKEMQETMSLMIAERTIEKSKQLGRDNVSGIGAGMISDVKVAQSRISQLRADPEKYARLQESAKRYRDWSDSVLRYLVEKGRISQKAYEQIKTNNEYYVAMQRLAEIAPGEEAVSFTGGRPSGKLGSASQPIKTFKGSSRTILNPYTNLMESTYRSIKEADRNDVLATFVEHLTASRGLGEGPVQNLASVGRRAMEGDKDTVAVYVDGEKQLWQFDDDVYKALKGIVEQRVILPGWLTALPRLFRSTIVNFPAFLVRNTMRDFQHRIVVSTDSNPLDQFRIRGPMDIENLKKFGGDQSGYYLKDRVDYVRAMEAAIRDLAQDKSSIVVGVKSLGKLYDAWRQWSEQTGRLAEYQGAYRKAKEKLGYDDYNAHLYAASKARGLMDFAVAGTTMRYINQVVPFSNAAIQGMKRTVQGFKEDPAGFSWRWILYAVLPTLATYLWNKQHGDLEEYQQQPAYLRDLFYNFKLGDNLWLRIPKSFELGVLASGVERAIDKAMGNDKAFDGYNGSVARSLLPVDEAALSGPFRGAVQVAANYDFFRQRAIIPQYEKKLKLELRETGRGSRLGQAIQSAIGVDSRNVDFLMRENFGLFGDMAVKVSDAGRKDRKSVGLSETGLFVQSPAQFSRDVEWLTKTATENGLENDPGYKYLKLVLKNYWDAEGDAAKQQAANELRGMASEIRAAWEEQLPFSRNRKIRGKQMEMAQ